MILSQKSCPLTSVSKISVTIQLQIEMKVKVEGSLTGKRLSSCVNNETIHNEKKSFLIKADQLLQYKIQTWILDLSYRVGCTSCNKHLLDKMVLIVI